MDAKSEKIALFRFGAIASLVLEPLPRGELTRRARGDRCPPLRHSRFQTHIGFRRYLAGLGAPLPQRWFRSPRAATPAGPRTVAHHHSTARRSDRTSQTREPASHRHHPVAGTGSVVRPKRPAISASTLYRFLKQRGLSERQLLAPPAHKKFEAEHSNQIWQSDMLFGPYVQRPGGGKMQALLHAILDDASRLIPHAQFYASQGLDACLDCLRQAVAARGARSGSTWITPRSIAARNWRGSPHPSAC